LRDEQSIVPGPPTELVRMQINQLGCDKERSTEFLSYIEQRFF